jgi:hypothetical protein
MPTYFIWARMNLSQKNKLLREELTDFSKQDISKKEWRKINISFLENHTYFHGLWKTQAGTGKRKNLDELKNKGGDTKKKKKDKPVETILGDFSDQVKKDSEVKKKGKD